MNSVSASRDETRQMNYRAAHLTAEEAIGLLNEVKPPMRLDIIHLPLLLVATCLLTGRDPSFGQSTPGGRAAREKYTDAGLGPVAMRLGPFEGKPGASDVQVDGKRPPATSVERSGDSWWVRFKMPVGP
jgi:hypothetical protein